MFGRHGAHDPACAPGELHANVETTLKGRDVRTAKYLHHVERERTPPMTASTPSAPPLPLQETAVETGPAVAPVSAAARSAGGPPSANHTATEQGSEDGHRSGAPVVSSSESHADCPTDNNENGNGGMDDPHTDSTDSMDAITAHITALEEEKQALLADLVVLDGPLQAEFAALEVERDDLSTAQTRLQTSISTAVSARQALQSRVHELEQAHAEKEELAQRAVLHAARLRDELARLEEDREQAKRQRIATARAYKDALRDQESLQLSVTNLESQRVHLTEDIAQRETMLVQAQAALEAVRHDVALLRAATRKLLFDADTEAAAATAVVADEGACPFDGCGDGQTTTDATDDHRDALSAEEGERNQQPVCHARQRQLATLQTLYERVQAALLGQSSEAVDRAHPKIGQVRSHLAASATLCQHAYALVTELEKVVSMEALR